MKFLKLFILLSMVFIVSAEPVGALTRENYCQDKYGVDDINICLRILREQGIEYVDLFERSGETGNSVAGSTQCISKALPQINDTAGLASAINQYIDDYLTRGGRNYTSPFQGEGQAFVDGGVANGINPMLAVAHLEVENGFVHNFDASGWHSTTYASPEAARAGDETQRVPSHNAFGREASDSQPHVYYYSRASNRIRTPYKWDSWGDSLSGPDNWFELVARRYADIPPDDLDAHVNRYAPSSDGNNVQRYVDSIRNTMRTIIDLSGESLGCGGGAGGAGGTYVWPIRREDFGRLTTCWNTPRNLNGSSYRHGGLDISAALGVEILATASGTIVNMGNFSGSGNLIVIRHDDGLYSFYKHQQRFASGIAIGTPVAAGQVIGYVNSTGASDGNHLHFDIGSVSSVQTANEGNANRTKNPLDFLPDDGRNYNTGGVAGECVPSSQNADGFINGGGTQNVSV